MGLCFYRKVEIFLFKILVFLYGVSLLELSGVMWFILEFLNLYRKYDFFFKLLRIFKIFIVDVLRGNIEYFFIVYKCFYFRGI